jgi:heme exporter protein B
VPLFAGLYDLPILTPRVLPIVILGTIGVSTIGTLFSAIAANTRAREILLPLLVFPLIVPVVIGAVKATQGLLVTIGDTPWLGLIAAFDVIFVSLSVVMFPFVIEE